MYYIIAYDIKSSLNSSKRNELEKKVSTLIEEKLNEDNTVYEKMLENVYIAASDNPNIEQEVFEIMKNVYLENDKNIELITTKLSEKSRFAGILDEGKWNKIDKITRPLNILDKQI